MEDNKNVHRNDRETSEVPVRVNVLNPDQTPGAPERVTAVTDPGGQTAHTATGQTVRITHEDGNLRDDVIVHGG